MEWNGNGMEILPQMKSMQNGMEMEWKWNGNGMEINGQSDMEFKLNGMEWKRKGNGMERLCRAMILAYGNIIVRHNLSISFPSVSIPFHLI